MVRVKVRNRVSVKVKDRFGAGIAFSGFSASIIQNYFLRATLQLRVNCWDP